jgi:hypothetical protein
MVTLGSSLKAATPNALTIPLHMIVGTETHLASKPIPPIVSSKQEMDSTRLTPFAPLNVIQLEMMESTLVILNISAVSMHSQASIAVRTVIAPVTRQHAKITSAPPAT